MLAISARIELASKDMAAYVAGAKKIIEPTRAEAGCQLYAIAVDIEHANVIWITEQWESEEHLYDHLATPHIAEFLALCAAVEITGMDVIKYDVSAAGPLEIPQS